MKASHLLDPALCSLYQSLLLLNYHTSLILCRSRRGWLWNVVGSMQYHWYTDCIIIDIQRYKRLNLTNPRMGSGVKIKFVFDHDTEVMWKKSWEACKINEFVWKLTPIDRGTPTSCYKLQKYWINFPMANHNEAISII